MGKYDIGDKVVIRKDLEVGKDYGDFEWHEGKEHLKEKDYVVISKYYGEAYEIDECIITDEMIEGLYKEEFKIKTKDKIKYKIGDKVVISNTSNAKSKYPDYLVVTGYKYTHHYINYELNNEIVIEQRFIEGLYKEKQDMNIEDVKKQIEGYFNKNISKIDDVIVDSKSKSNFNVKYMNEYEIELQEKKVKINKLLLELLKLDHELKSMVNYK